MSFVDKVKYISQLAVVDEFGGRGHADKITRFYIVLRVTDGSGNEVEVTAAEVEEAVAAKNIVLCDYPDNDDFIVSGRQYKNNTNFIVVGLGGFSGSTSLCVSFRNDDGSVIASTAYLSDFPSCFFLNKKTPG
ncbi:hypothetical protein [Pantoea agglomerans]|uniref:hypothetical protein n=1 Tax=Enterobacter agglomerans TaxID=549 RepID=UPI00241340EC|nr:hypothetical protein [Pantoea agglomerans]